MAGTALGVVGYLWIPIVLVPVLLFVGIARLTTRRRRGHDAPSHPPRRTRRRDHHPQRHHEHPDPNRRH